MLGICEYIACLNLNSHNTIPECSTMYAPRFRALSIALWTRTHNTPRPQVLCIWYPLKTALPPRTLYSSQIGHSCLLHRVSILHTPGYCSRSPSSISQAQFSLPLSSSGTPYLWQAYEAHGYTGISGMQFSRYSVSTGKHASRRWHRKHSSRRLRTPVSDSSLGGSGLGLDCPPTGSPSPSGHLHRIIKNSVRNISFLEKNKKN